MESVVEEPVPLVPELDSLAAHVVHRVRDVDEVLEELRRQVLVGGIVLGELEGDGEHVQAVHPDPCGAVGLLEVAADGQRRRAVEDPDVVEPEESPLEDVLPLGILAVHPPGEVQEQLLEDALEKAPIGDAPDPLLDLVDAPGRPGVHRRVHVPERPLVGRNLAVRVHVPLAEEEDELVLREVGIHQRQRDRVEREVPGRVPRILPLVRHRDDVVVVEMRPFGVPPASARRRRRRLAGIALEPAPDLVVVPLLRPEHPRQRLAHDAPRVLAEAIRHHGRVELVGLAQALGEGLFELRARTAPPAGPSTSRSRRTVRPPAGIVSR